MELDKSTYENTMLQVDRTAKISMGQDRVLGIKKQRIL